MPEPVRTLPRKPGEHIHPHFNLGLGGYKSCLCDCFDCYSQVKVGCLCPECGCADPNYTVDHESVANRPVVTPIIEVVEHPCVMCGHEVIRRGTRGRWPGKCAECR